MTGQACGGLGPGCEGQCTGTCFESVEDMKLPGRQVGTHSRAEAAHLFLILLPLIPGTQVFTNQAVDMVSLFPQGSRQN